MEKAKLNFIEINKKSIKKGWIIIVPFHIAFMIMSIFPIIKCLKNMNLLYGLIINLCYQILLVGLICYFLKDFLVKSWRYFDGNGIKRNIKSVFGGFIICFALYFIFRIIVFACSLDTAASQNQSNASEYVKAFPLAFVLLSVVVGPFTEECIYRGFIYQTLRQYNRVIANLGSALLFGFMHVLSTIAEGKSGISQVIILIVNYAIGGVGLGIVQERYKNIWVNYFVHVLWNTIGTIPLVILSLMK